jgi:hypothetical protein
LQYTAAAPGSCFRRVRDKTVRVSSCMAVLYWNPKLPATIEPGRPDEWLNSILTVMSRYLGSAMTNSGRYRTAGASRSIFPSSTSSITAVAV